MDITQDVVLRAESLPTSLEPTDFLERICALVGVRRETARLAYKWHTDTANAAPRALSTDADVHNLFDENNRRRRQWRHGQRVPKITVINLAAVPRTAAARKAAEKKRKLDEAVASGQSSDESCAAEFERCRQRLRCPHRNSDNAYCWVNPKDPMKHCQPLATWECNCGHVSWYVLFSKDGRADPDCLLPPNTPLFDRLLDSSKERSSSSRKANQSNPTIIIHNHVPNPLSDASSVLNDAASNPCSGTEVAVDVDAEPLPIADLLRTLEEVMPDAKFTSFEGALKKEGFYYAENVLDYKNDTDYLVSKVGIPGGLVRTFVRRVEHVVNARKRRRLNDGSIQILGTEDAHSA
ncbi:hypothetical protein FKP32DRAFT_1692704 [Trametes sanguinea]|nr:hypothetical protein FKP32DRAFT_1692704 [Trametes sanguinea]